jgi:hypothetical protein
MSFYTTSFCWFLEGIFDLPSAFKNRKIEVIIFPVEEKANEIPQFTMEQIIEWSQSPLVRWIPILPLNLNRARRAEVPLLMPF